MNILIQPNYSIGLIGHVSHGKTSICRSLSGIETYKFSKEKERGITMKIGYANCKIFKCPICPEPECYHPTGSKNKSIICSRCNTECILVQYFSFIDSPGHESLMNVMLSGAQSMDYALLLIDGSQKCPQPQTVEHLAALELLKVKKIIIIQNKLDLIDGNKAREQYLDIQKFIKGTCAEKSPIIPISTQKCYNLDILCEYIVKYFGMPERQSAKPLMNVLRSFDCNKPGIPILDLVGGVLGGSLLSGQFKIGDTVEIRPGIIQQDDKQNITWKPIRTTIVNMKTDNDDIAIANPGGLIAIETLLDPQLTRSDRMIGQVVGFPDSMPNVYLEIRAKCSFMELVNMRDTNATKPKQNDTILLNIASKPIFAIVKKVTKKATQNVYHFRLKYPCCINIGERFSISAKIINSWRLVGMGEMINDDH